MRKTALLVYGKPRKKDSVFKFNMGLNKNIKLMGEVADLEGYSVKELPLEGLNYFISKENCFDNDFLFYFTGHADKDHLGSKLFFTNDLLSKMNDNSVKKFIVLDACAGSYEGGENFEALDLPRNSRIIGAKEVYDNKSLAKLLHEKIKEGKLDIEQINKETFDQIKHNWVYFKETK